MDELMNINLIELSNKEQLEINGGFLRGLFKKGDGGGILSFFVGLLVGFIILGARGEI